MNENKNVKKTPLNSRPVPRLVIIPATLLLLATMLNCAGPHVPLGERLLSPNDRTKRSAFRELDALDMPAKKKYLGTMKNTLRDNNPANRVLAVESLGLMGPMAEEALPDLIWVLHEDNSEVRARAIKTLVRIGTAAVPALIEALKHQDPVVRCSAAETLGSIGSGAGEAIPLLTLLLSDKDYTVSRQVASALGLIGPAAVPALTQVARGVDSRATEMAETAFSYLKAEPEIVRGLAHVLGNADEHAGVRVFAAKALGKLQEKGGEATPALVHALGDPNNDIRSAATGVLGRIGPTAVPALRAALTNADPRVRSGAATALGAIGSVAEEVIPALVQALQDEDGVVRIDVIAALDKTRATSRVVVRALIRVLDQDKNDFVRLSAARVLNKIGTYEAEEAVQKYNTINSRQ